VLFDELLPFFAFGGEGVEDEEVAVGGGVGVAAGFEGLAEVDECGAGSVVVGGEEGLVGFLYGLVPAVDGVALSEVEAFSWLVGVLNDGGSGVELWVWVEVGVEEVVVDFVLVPGFVVVEDPADLLVVGGEVGFVFELIQELESEFEVVGVVFELGDEMLGEGGGGLGGVDPVDVIGSCFFGGWWEAGAFGGDFALVVVEEGGEFGGADGVGVVVAWVLGCVDDGDV